MIKRRLLLVDDEETVLFALERYFSRAGFSVDCARELEEAEALASYTAYDLVIADLSLTDDGSTEGLEVLRYVRRCCRTARLILLTGFSTPAIVREALKRGADACLEKPHPLAEIVRTAFALLGDAA